MDFHPVPKPSYRKKKPNRKRKKVETFRGVSIPSRRVRSSISKTDYQRSIDYHGAYCLECGNPLIEMHHTVFRSQGGSGKFRNIIPLCNEHHRKAHTERAYADKWRDYLKELFGPHFHKDKFSLWKEGLIVNCTDEAFENFFKG